MLSKLSLSPRLTSATNHPPSRSGFVFGDGRTLCIVSFGMVDVNRIVPNTAVQLPVSILYGRVFSTPFGPPLLGDRKRRRGAPPLCPPHIVSSPGEWAIS